MEYRKEIKMKEFSIYCKNKKEADKVLKKLEEQGYLWNSGDRPTEWYPSDYRNDNDDICFDVGEKSKNISWGKNGNGRYFRTSADYLGENKIIIYTSGKQVIAKNIATKKEAIAKCHPDDEFDFSIGARLAFDRLMGVEEPIKEEPKYYNGKVVCVESATWETTKGKIYDVIDGWITFDEGRTSNNRFIDIDDINNKLMSKFIELVK